MLNNESYSYDQNLNYLRPHYVKMGMKMGMQMIAKMGSNHEPFLFQIPQMQFRLCCSEHLQKEGW